MSVDALSELKSSGFRITQARIKLLKILEKSTQPIEASDLVTKIKVNKTTIYRELDFLEAQNLITESDFGDGKKRYELTSKGHHHHIVCTKCDKVECIDVQADLEKEQLRLEKENNFKINSHSLEFFGLCGDCK